ncbi:hypothetical protein SeMB42_g05410 [Synchytrium endobioticum]|uniref:DH domain-containing protein n=1 Tax=Synchytrium endobioticum TaxID=286115 RepID=A0A507CRM8_9FUNG|nr:hypothetical protein SeMB42_g05410 [Synchytrium endobioticum]
MVVAHGCDLKDPACGVDTTPRKRVEDLAKMFEQQSTSSSSSPSTTSRTMTRQQSAAARASTYNTSIKPKRRISSSVTVGLNNYHSGAATGKCQQPASQTSGNSTWQNQRQQSQLKRCSSGSEDGAGSEDLEISKSPSVSRLSKIFEAEDFHQLHSLNDSPYINSFGISTSRSPSRFGIKRHASSKPNSSALSIASSIEGDHQSSSRRSMRFVPPIPHQRPAKSPNLSADPIITSGPRSRAASISSLTASRQHTTQVASTGLHMSSRQSGESPHGICTPPDSSRTAYMNGCKTCNQVDRSELAAVVIMPLAERVTVLNAGGSSGSSLRFDNANDSHTDSYNKRPSSSFPRTPPESLPNSPSTMSHSYTDCEPQPPSPATHQININICTECTPPAQVDFPEVASPPHQFQTNNVTLNLTGLGSPLSPSAATTRSPTPMPSDDGRDMLLTEEELSRKRDERRAHVLRELVETERSFLNDMEALRDVFYYPALQTGVLSVTDIRILFSNIEAVIEISRWFLTYLEAACNPEDDYAGDAFLNAAPQLEEVFTEFCKHNEASITRLQDLVGPSGPDEAKEFLKSGQAQLAGRTQAWDLGSLLIKPVQRVLKYPLLIKQLIKDTTPTHSDSEQLRLALKEMERIAEKINEVKKRRDIVEKYVEGKGQTNIVRGINKKLARGTQRVKEGVGLSTVNVDMAYESLAGRFEAIQAELIDLRQNRQLGGCV